MNNTKMQSLDQFPITAIQRSLKIYSKMAFLALLGLNGMAVHAQNAQSSPSSKEEASALDAVVVTGTTEQKT